MKSPSMKMHTGLTVPALLLTVFVTCFILFNFLNDTNPVGVSKPAAPAEEQSESNEPLSWNIHMLLPVPDPS